LGNIVLAGGKKMKKFDILFNN